MLYKATPPLQFRLSRAHRLIIMGLFIASFFAISPLIILYTAGFRYDWSNHSVATTGVLSVDVQPDDAKVYVNDSLVRKSIPIRLANLAPGSYSIRIERDGYRPWKKDIDIFSNQTTFIKDVTLFKDAQPQLKKTADRLSVTQLWVIANLPDTILISENTPTSTIIKKISPTDNQETILFSAPSSTQIIATISPAHDQLGVIIPGAQTTQVSVFALDGTNARATGFYHAKIVSYQWSKNDAGAGLYVADGGTLQLLTAGRSPRLISSLPDQIWFVDVNQKIWIVKDKTLTTLETTPNRPAFSLEKPINGILDINSNRSVFTITGGILVVTRHDDGQESRIVPALDYLYQPNTKEWWAWSSWELASIYPSGDVAVLNRTGEPMTTIRPLDKFGVNLTVNNNRLSGFNPGYYITQSLAEFTSIQAVDVDEVRRIIYVAGEKDGKSGIFTLEY